MASQIPNDQTAAINAEVAAALGRRSSPSPFQLRFDLLHLAKDILEMNIHLARCLLYTSPSPRDATLSRMPSSA